MVVGQVARLVVSARAEAAQRTEERDGARAELEAAASGLAWARGTMRDEEEAARVWGVSGVGVIADRLLQASRRQTTRFT